MCSCIVLTFNNAGLRQCRFHGRRLRFCLRGGSGLLNVAGSSSATTAAGSSPSQVKSVDFLQSTQLVVNPVQLPNQMNYSGRISTYKLGRTTVTVGAPRMLAMSTNPASADASACASVVAASSATAAAGSVLPSTTGGWCVSYAKSSSTVGAGLRLPPTGSPTVSQSPSSPCSTRSEGGISCKQWSFIVSTLHRDTSTRLRYSRRLTS
jgi:hypothetical protein